MDVYGRLTKDIEMELASVLGSGGIITQVSDVLENY